MISILICLLIGWLLHFVHLNDVFYNLLHFNITEYYLVWFGLGVVNVLRGLFKGGK